MSDEEKGNLETQGVNSEEIPEQYKNYFEKLLVENREAVRQESKSEIAGLNRKISEVQAEKLEKEQALEEAKIDGLTELQKVQHELEQVKSVLTVNEKEKLALKLSKAKVDFLSGKKIDTEVADYLKGNNADEAHETLEKFATWLEKHDRGIIDTKLVSNSGKPPGGEAAKSQAEELSPKNLLGKSELEFWRIMSKHDPSFKAKIKDKYGAEAV